MRIQGLGTRLRHLLDLLDGDLTVAYRESGLSMYRPRYTPIVRALLALGPAPITALAARAGVTHSAVSQTVAEMRRRKLVTAARGNDARERTIALAPAGERLLPALEAQWRATNRAVELLDRELTAPLSTVVDEAIAALERRPFRERVRMNLPAPRSKRLEAPRASTGRSGRSRAATFVALTAALPPILHTTVHAQDHPPATRIERRVRPAAPPVFGDHADIEMQDFRTVMVTVNGRGPYRFSIDTGAQGHARVSTALVTELGLRQVGEIISGDPSGQNRQTLPVYGLATLVLGDLTFIDVAAPELSLADGIDGMLGLDLFRDLLLTLDYGGARLIAMRGELPPADGATVLNYTPGPSGSVQIATLIGDFETLLNLDTGAVRMGMALPQRKVTQIATRGQPRMIGRAKTASQEFDLWSVELAVPVRVGTVMLPITSVTFPSPDPVGVIGSGALRTMAVTIDQRNNRVRIVPSGKRP
jgi:DNA-binding MarR family transcriptional regulator